MRKAKIDAKEALARRSAAVMVVAGKAGESIAEEVT
jgi:hypothetical protein